MKKDGNKLQTATPKWKKPIEKQYILFNSRDNKSQNFRNSDILSVIVKCLRKNNVFIFSEEEMRWEPYPSFTNTWLWSAQNISNYP